MDRFVRLDAATAEEYSALVPKDWRRALSRASSEGPVIAVGAALLGRPVAIGLASVRDGEEGWAEWITVASAFRGRGIGTALLARLEQEIAAQGASVARTRYALGRPGVPAVERILQKRGWGEPQPFYVACRVEGENAVRIMQAPWMTGLPIPAEFQVFPWDELTEAERERLLQQHTEEPIWEDDLDPFDVTKNLDPASSLGMRRRGEIVGWCLTQRIAPGQVLWANLFVRRQFRTTARGVALLAESIRRHWADEGHLPTYGGVWQTPCTMAPMLAFIRRRLGPYLSEMVETKESRKRLAAQPSRTQG